MALITLTQVYPDKMTPGNAHDPRRVSSYNRWVNWSAWRNSTAVDVYPHALTHPDHYPGGVSYDGRVIDVRGCDNLLIVATAETLTAAGLMTDIAAWEAELWVMVGPPTEAQWVLVDGTETGAMAGKTFYKNYQVPGVWFAMFRISSRTGVGVMKLGARQL